MPGEVIAMLAVDTLKALRDGAKVVTRREPWPLIYTVRKRRLSYLDRQALADLHWAVKQAEGNRVPGALVEAGSALGGSAIVMAAAKHPDRELLVFDAFGMIPPPSDKDGGDVQARYERIAAGEADGLNGDQYYGYEPDLMAKVVDNFASTGYPVEANRVRLVPGMFEDTMPEVAGPIAVAHVDGDWYSSTMACLENLVPLLAPGGRIVVDDYYHWSGCRTAVDEYLAGGRRLLVEHRSRLHLVKA